jgi:hypothetical protein
MKPDFSVDQVHLVGELPPEFYSESLVYDHGHREALRAQLAALIKQAERQAQRSYQTAINRKTDLDAWKVHSDDVNLIAALSRVYGPRI